MSIETTSGLREDFIKFFRNNDHKYLKPSKVILDNDPSLFFVNSGMVQLKDVFVGIKPFDEKYSKLVNCQISIRAGGKKCDLEEVGKDSYHLSNFSMCGFWSLNSYWKLEAINLSFNYLIKCGLNPKQMYATYFEGNNDIPEDVESKNIWIGLLGESNVVPGSFKDNYWMMGTDGPSGPCTEIHYDIINSRSNSSHLVNKDDPTLIELWNIVMMQYNVTTTGNIMTFKPLEKRFIDCGWGLERLAMVLQNKSSIYQTDIFVKLIKYVEILSNGKSYTDLYTTNHIDADYIDTNNVSVNKDISIRIFVDHIKTLVISIYDGGLFDCNGRGFVLRKIMRRMLTHFYIYLNDNNAIPIMEHHLIPAFITEILNFHMFFTHDSISIKNILIQEERTFLNRLNKFKLLYKSSLKKYKTPEDTINMLLSNASKYKETHGVDIVIIKNIDKLNISM